jgi:hypothetical protein
MILQKTILVIGLSPGKDIKIWNTNKAGFSYLLENKKAGRPVYDRQG